MTEPRGKAAKRKQAEEALRESEEQLRNVLEVSRDLIYKLNLQTRTYDYVSPSSLRLVGFEPQEIVAMGLEGVIERFHPDDREGFRTHPSRLPDDAAEGREAPTIEYRWQCRDGEYRWLSDNRAFVLDEAGRALALVGTVRDVTEDKQAEEELRESEARYKALFAGAPEGMLVADLQTKQFRHANPAMCRMFGYTEEEFLRIGVADIHPKESLSYVLAEFEAQARGEKLLSADLPCQRKDGSLFYANVNTTMVALDGRRCNVGFFTDVTERRQAEEALQESLRLLRDTGEMAMVGGWELDLSTKEVSWTEEVGRIHGVEPGYKPKLEEALSFYAPESRPAVEAAVKKAVETGEPYDLESLFIPLGSKDKIWVRSLGKAVYSGGKIVKLAGTFQNTDERKRADEALRESEERFRLAINATEDGLWEWDIQTNQEFFSPRWCEIIGYSFDDPELPHTYKSWASRIHPDDHDRVISAMNNHLQKGTRYDVDYRHRHKSGEYRWQNSKGQAVLDESGKPIRMVGCISDITERKQAEEALRESEEQLRNVLEVSRDLIYKLNLQTRTYDYVSPSSLRLVGFEPQEIVAMGLEGVIERFHPDDREGFRTHPSRLPDDAAEGREAPTIEYRWQCRDGEYRWLSDNRAFVLDEAGRALALVGTVRDVTEDKQAEEALRESEQRFRNVLDVSRDFIYKIDLRTGTYDYASPSVLELTGFTLEEVVAMGVRGLGERIHPEDGKRLTEQLKDLTKDWDEGHRNTLSVYRWKRKDGEYRWFSDNNVFIRYSNEQPATLIGAVRDITAEKQAEEEIANRLKMESGIAQASTLLAGPEDIDAALQLALRILSEAVGADRAHLFLFRDNDTRMDNTSEWCAPGVEPQIDNLQDLDCAAIPWWMGKLAQNDPIIMTDTSAVPPDTVAAKKSWKALNIRSLLAVPLLSDGKPIGYVRFANMESASNEREEDIRLLRLASESITSFIERQRAGEDKRKAYESIVMLLATGAEARDPYTEDHLPRMRGFAEAMAAELGLPPGEIREIGLCSLLHDLGKMRVPDSILIKPGPLSQAEWKIMKQHSAWGEELLSTHPWLGTARQIARWHHESWDGSGYPDGLRGEEIPLCAAIVAVADGFDAMISDRPYKKAWPPRQAIVEIRAQKGRQYSPDAVEAFNRALRKGRIGRITSGDSACLPEMSEAA